MMHAHLLRTCMDAINLPDTRRKILILEQDEYLASLMHLLLYREGFDIAAIAHIDQLSPQLDANYAPMMIFVSHRWLREDEPAVLKMIQGNSNWKSVPLIMMMNYFDLDLVERVSAMGITDHLLQPFEPSALIDMICKYGTGKHLN